MATSYLKRLDVAYPQQANPKDVYQVRIFENEDLSLLNAEVNSWLLDLPAQGGNDWIPHVISVAYDNYSILNPPALVHTVMVTFYVTGTLQTPYSG